MTRSFHCTLLGTDAFRVLAVGAPDDCQVLDTLLSLAEGDNKAARGMLALLTERLPRLGIDGLAHGKWKLLEDGIGEFRQLRGRGKGIRVLAFRSERTVIVCTTAFEKESEVPRREIELARRLRADYTGAAKAGLLRTHRLDDDGERR